MKYKVGDKFNIKDYNPKNKQTKDVQISIIMIREGRYWVKIGCCHRAFFSESKLDSLEKI